MRKHKEFYKKHQKNIFKATALVVIVAAMVFMVLGGSFLWGKDNTAKADPIFTPGTDTYTFIADQVVGFDTKYDGHNIVVGKVGTAVTLTLDGTHSFKSLTVQYGAKVTHSPANMFGLVDGVQPAYTSHYSGFIQLDGPRTFGPNANLCGNFVIDGKTYAPTILSKTSCKIVINLKAGVYSFSANGGATPFFLNYITLNSDKNAVYLRDNLYLNSDKKAGTCGIATSLTGHGLCAEFFNTSTVYPFFRMIWDPQNTGDDRNGMSGYVNEAGLELKIDGELTLNAGSIDVSGKGFPGGIGNSLDEQSVLAGYGPGGGPYFDSGGISDGRGIGGAGAGYGGIGGKEWNSMNFSFGQQGQVYSNLTTPQNEPYVNIGVTYKTAFPHKLVTELHWVPQTLGSGGAGGIHEWSRGHHFETGGTGGGSIIITAASISGKNGSRILANGNNGECYNDGDSGRDDIAGGGGGSGGLIYVNAATISSDNPLPPAAPQGSRGGLDNSGAGYGTIYPDNPVQGVLIDAAGGIGCSMTPNHYSGDGGGGRVVVNGSAQSGPPGGISGDIYAGGDINLPHYTVDDNSIVAGGKITFSTAPKNKINNYPNPPGVAIDWNQLKNDLNQDYTQLINERAKTVAAGTFSGLWNLGTDSNNPATPALGTYSEPPEGEVWYVPGDLTLGTTTVPTTYSGRGTIIVGGKLTINNNISTSDANGMLGIIVRGSNGITINYNKNSPAQDYAAFLYTNNGSITFNGDYSTSVLNFKGLMAASANVTLPKAVAAGSTIVYDNRLAKNPLPGFAQLLQVVRGEVAP